MQGLGFVGFAAGVMLVAWTLSKLMTNGNDRSG
jgi:hypothetical protein